MDKGETRESDAMACRSSSVGVRAGRGGGLRGVSRRVVSPVAVSGRRARVVHYAGRCVEAAPACSAGGEGVRRRRRAVRKEQSGAAVVVASAGAGLEGFWSVVCGTWAGVIGSVRAGAARAARAGGLVIQCNKKRGKACTVRVTLWRKEEKEDRETHRQTDREFVCTKAWYQKRKGDRYYI